MMEDAEARCPTLLRVRVVCAANASHSVSGLFVVLRARRLTGEAQKLCPTAGDEATDAIHLSFVDRDGILRLVHDGNPWSAFYRSDAVHDCGLSPIQRYEGCLIRHPDPGVVRDFVAYLRTGEGAARFQHDWGASSAVFHPLDLTLDTVAGDQLVLRVPEIAAAYLPRGGECYDGWSLYRDMPHGACLENQVHRLQADLAMLRFPVGSQESPYASVARSATKPSPDQNRGVFDGKVQAAVGRYQEHAREGCAFQLSEAAKPEAHRGNAYAFLLGSPVSRPPALHDVTLGMVDAATAVQIRSWLALGLRKPGDILLPLSPKIGEVWMLQAGAVACEAWSQLLLACGSYELKSGHSFRNVLDKGFGNGKLLNSIHKTGLAIDFHGGATDHANADFPVRFEAHWALQDRATQDAQNALARAATDRAHAKARHQRAEQDHAAATTQLDTDKTKLDDDQVASMGNRTLKVDQQRVRRDTSRRDMTATALRNAQAALATAEHRVKDAETALRKAEQAAKEDEAGAKKIWKVRWRLYAHSELDVFSEHDSAQALTALKNQLQAYPAALAERLGKRFGGLHEHAEATAWIAQAIAPARAVAAELARMDDTELIDAYFRREISQWLFDLYEVDGGSRSAEPWPATYSQRGFPPPQEPLFVAKSYVNLSALGAKLQMARIGGNRARDVSVGKDGKVKTVQLAIPKAAETIARLLAYLNTLPDGRHAGDEIAVFRGKVKLTTYTPGELDAELMVNWLDALRDMVPDPRKLEAMFARATGFDVRVTLAATKTGTSVVKKLSAGVGGESFGGKQFIIVDAGPTSGLAAGTTATGAELQVMLDDAMARFQKLVEQEEADAETKVAEDKAAGTSSHPRSKIRAKQPVTKPGPRPKRKPRDSTRKERADWSATVRPLFAINATLAGLVFAPGDQVRLPAPKSANLADLWRPLEWWHYQHEDAFGVAWGELLSRCGFSRAILAGADPPGDVNAIAPRGVDYSAHDLDDIRGGCPAGTVENHDKYPTGG
jgi:hypothetical protein